LTFFLGSVEAGTFFYRRAQLFSPNNRILFEILRSPASGALGLQANPKSKGQFSKTPQRFLGRK
jgi:hypothetical protein